MRNSHSAVGPLTVKSLQCALNRTVPCQYQLAIFVWNPLHYTDHSLDLNLRNNPYAIKYARLDLFSGRDIMNTKDHIVSRPGGMTVAEFKKRHKRTFAEDLNGDQVLVGSVGLNISGALAGIRASSFPNPVLATPPATTMTTAKPRKDAGMISYIGSEQSNQLNWLSSNYPPPFILKF